MGKRFFSFHAGRVVLVLLGILWIIGLQGCRFDYRVKGVDLPEAAPRQLVIYSYLNPVDSVTWIYVGRTQPYDFTGQGDLGSMLREDPLTGRLVPEWKRDYSLAEARVTLEDLTTGARAEGVFDVSNKVYRVSGMAVPVQVGHRYRVRAEHADYGAAYGDCEIRAHRDLDVKLWFKNEKLYYSISMHGDVVDRYLMVQLRSLVRDRYSGEFELLGFERVLVKGNTLEGIPYNESELIGTLTHQDSVCIYPAELDAATYEFLRSYDLQRAMGDNPLESPVRVQCNVVGGVGVVGCRHAYPVQKYAVKDIM